MKNFTKLLTLSILSIVLVGCGNNPSSTETVNNLVPTIEIETTEEKPTESKDSTENNDTNTSINNNTMVTLQTNLGDIELILFREGAPKTTDSFLRLAKDGKYDGVVFHRVIDGFMIQGGDFENGNGTGGHAYGGGEIEDEFIPGKSHLRGRISTANRGPNTNGSQFFIMHQDGPFLDGKHSVFGEVVKGMDIVDKIATAEKDYFDMPLEDIIIEKAIVSDEVLKTL